MKNSIFYFLLVFTLMCFGACNDNNTDNGINEWNRNNENPVFRDLIPTENYQAASDPHVFFDDNGDLAMIYTGDHEGKPAIKLAIGSDWTNWQKIKPLLYKTGPSGLDINKETAFYHRAASRKHQIYYIGYEEEATYESQIFLAEADSLTGEFTQMEMPIIPKGIIAEKNVYMITSPSVVEHNGLLYITFLGWNNEPNEVTEVWVLGATSDDNGHTWKNFQVVDTRIGMEGQVTKVADDQFVAVSTGEFENKEAIYYSTSTHPFNNWSTKEEPILIQAGPPYESNELIAPQITADPQTNTEYLFYTGADYDIGWWVMLATEN